MTTGQIREGKESSMAGSYRQHFYMALQEPFCPCNPISCLHLPPAPGQDSPGLHTAQGHPPGPTQRPGSSPCVTFLPAKGSSRNRQMVLQLSLLILNQMWPKTRVSRWRPKCHLYYRQAPRGWKERNGDVSPPRPLDSHRPMGPLPQGNDLLSGVEEPASKGASCRQQVPRLGIRVRLKPAVREGRGPGGQEVASPGPQALPLLEFII